MTLPADQHPYLAFLSRMRADTVADLALYCDPQVRFRDPFHDVSGVDRYIAICTAMFDAMHVDAFEIAAVHSENPCTLEWTLRYRFRSGLLPSAPGAIAGASVVHFTGTGRVSSHTDYWDANVLLARMPLVGALVRSVKARVAATAR